MRVNQSESGASVPRVVSRNRTDLSAWVALETVSVARNASTAPDLYHAFSQADYVHVLTMTKHGAFVLVQQYRPVIERWTLELPGGLREPSEDPQFTAIRELKEETGFATSEVVPLVEAHADAGRLSNKFFGFFAVADQVADPEPGIAVVLATGEELRDYATAGRIAMPAHIGLLYLAAINPLVRELCHRYGYYDVPWMT
jgi:8-oxo-dGTP pyrophosphatase MutT (NUDIX family)